MGREYEAYIPCTTEGLMIRVMECGEEPARLLHFGTGTASATIEPPSYAFQDDGMGLDVASSPSALMFATESGAIPCDPQTGIDRRWYIVQAVYDLWEVHPSSETFESDGTRECKLVFIGRHLKGNDLKGGLQACLVKESIRLSLKGYDVFNPVTEMMATSN